MNTQQSGISLEMFRYNTTKYMQTHGYSVRSFAPICGIPVPTLARYVSGDTPVNITGLVKIAKAMNVTTDWLLGITASQSTDLPPEIRRFIDVYSIASEGDKKVINALLDKYKPLEP